MFMKKKKQMYVWIKRKKVNERGAESHFFFLSSWLQAVKVKSLFINDFTNKLNLRWNCQEAAVPVQQKCTFVSESELKIRKNYKRWLFKSIIVNYDHTSGKK